MKKRFLSVVLALCLCISSQSVAFAIQDTETEISEDVDMETETETVETTGKLVHDTDTAVMEETEEGTEMEEATEELETSDDVDADLQEIPPQQKNVPVKPYMGRPSARENAVPTPAEAYAAMIALKDQDAYKEGTAWTNEEPYSDSKGYYRWKGGSLGGTNIAAVGCVAFAFILSDEAFGSLPARMYALGGFEYEDIKAGDILRVNNDAHTVIVLEVSDSGVVVAEGNISAGDHRGKVHWGRGISRAEVMSSTSHYITRYPENYTAPDDPEADKEIAQGSLGGLTWSLTNAGTLTVSGSGAMPDHSSASEQPWNAYGSKIRKVVIGNGVTSIGSCAFWGCGVLGAEIPSSVKVIGNSAFKDTGILSVKIPSSVKTIGDSAFENCQSLSSVTVPEGVETIGQSAFHACTGLTSISLPASIGKVGSSAFSACQKLTSATFAPGSGQVTMGDNIFTQCYYLLSVKLPENIDCIGEGMFQNCGMLAGVEIPQGAESIKTWAFASCSGMSVVVIPDSVKTIGTAAFANCPLTDIYFTGDEAQWKAITKQGDTASAVLKATIHYNYVPATNPDPGEGDDDDNDDGSTGDNNGQKPGDLSSDSRSDKRDAYKDDSGRDNTDAQAAARTWKPTTPDEVRRYACVGRESIRCTLPEDNAYPVDIENAVQGPMCFRSFEAVLGEYTIGRTYNIYADSKTTYSTEQKIKLTIRIPSALYRKDREYKMICVTKGGQPIVYEDLDSDPETITIETDKFHAYALIYK